MMASCSLLLPATVRGQSYGDATNAYTTDNPLSWTSGGVEVVAYINNLAWRHTRHANTSVVFKRSRQVSLSAFLTVHTCVWMHAPTDAFHVLMLLLHAPTLVLYPAANRNIDVTVNYPSGYNLDNIISVGAIASNGDRASFSNYGATSVDIFAPGDGIWSSVPDNAYASYSGTSMATPMVSGAVALFAAAHKQYLGVNPSAATIKAAVMDGTPDTRYSVRYICCCMDGATPNPVVLHVKSFVKGRNTIRLVSSKARVFIH
jgi:hypothetical protein